jgi:hypothetical protein
MAAHSLIKGLIVGSGLLAAAVQASSGDHRLNARDNGGYRPEPQGHFVCVEQHKIVKVTVGEPGGECTMTTTYPGTSVGYPPGTTLTPTPTSTPPPAFSCDEGGYLIQGTVLYRLNLETGDNPAINENVGPGGNINAIGYNILDNYLYGFVAVSGGRWQLIQIDAEGGHQLLPLTVDRFYSTGDIDANGQLWIGASGTTAWAQIDLDPDSARYGQLVDSGTMKVPGNFVADWVFLENGGPYLYSIAWSTTARLVRWSIEDRRLLLCRIRHRSRQGKVPRPASYIVSPRFKRPIPARLPSISPSVVPAAHCLSSLICPSLCCLPTGPQPLLLLSSRRPPPWVALRSAAPFSATSSCTRLRPSLGRPYHQTHPPPPPPPPPLPPSHVRQGETGGCHRE